MLPDSLTFEVDYESFPRPPVFQWLQEAGGVAEAEMRRTFNCGIGMICAVEADAAKSLCARLNEAGEPAFIIGELKAV